MNTHDDGYDSDLDREDEEIEVGEQTHTIIDDYIGRDKDEDEQTRHALKLVAQDASLEIPQVEIKIEELDDGDEDDRDIILKISIDDEARRVAIEALDASISEYLCRLDDTFYVDIAKVQKEIEFETVENGFSLVECLRIRSSRQEMLWSRIARCEPVVEFMRSHGLSLDVHV